MLNCAGIPSSASRSETPICSSISRVRACTTAARDVFAPAACRSTTATSWPCPTKRGSNCQTHRPRADHQHLSTTGELTHYESSSFASTAATNWMCSTPDVRPNDPRTSSTQSSSHSAHFMHRLRRPGASGLHPSRPHKRHLRLGGSGRPDVRPLFVVPGMRSWTAMQPVTRMETTREPGNDAGQRH
jgi:hypothetical protein